MISHVESIAKRNRVNILKSSTQKYTKNELNRYFAHFELANSLEVCGDKFWVKYIQLIVKSAIVTCIVLKSCLCMIHSQPCFFLVLCHLGRQDLAADSRGNLTV